MRDWLSTHHASNKSGAQWIELWNIATQSDFELAGLDDRRTLERFASSDMLEINLRRLAAFVYEQRTQDKTGAAHMLAVVTRTEVVSQMEERASLTKAKAKEEAEETARNEGVMVPALKGDRVPGVCILGGRGAHRFDGSGLPLSNPTPQPFPLRRSGQASLPLSLLSF